MKLQKKIIIAILIILLGINNLSFSFLVKNNHNDILDETNIIETNNDKLEIIEETDDKVVSYPDLEINMTNYSVTYKGQRVEMPPKIGVHPRDNDLCHAMPRWYA